MGPLLRFIGGVTQVEDRAAMGSFASCTTLVVVSLEDVCDGSGAGIGLVDLLAEMSSENPRDEVKS